MIAIVAEERHVEIFKNHWRDGWKTAHKDHPRYPAYSKYAITFAAARLEEEKEDREE